MPDVSALARRATMLRAVAFVGVSEIAAKIGSVVATLIIARALGAELFGQWSYAVALTGLIGLLAEAGLTNALQQRIARGDDDQGVLVSNALGMKLAAALVAFGLVGVFAVAGAKPGPVAFSLLMLGFFSIANTASMTIQGVFRASGASHLDAITRVAQQLVLLAGVLLFAMTTSAGMIAFGAGYALAGATGLGLSAWFLRRAIPVGVRFDRAVWTSLARDAWPFWVAGMLWIAYFRLDVVVLSYLSSDRQTGLYNMAYNGFQVLTMPAAILAAGLFPSMTHLHHTDRLRFSRLRAKTQAVCIASGAAIAVVAALLVEPAIRLVAGSEFMSSVLLFRVLAISLVFLYPNYALFQALSAAGRQRLVMAAAAIGATTNLGLNLALIPSLDALGASIATVATEALVFLVLSVMAWRVLGSTARERASASPATVPIEPLPSGGQRAA